jgi:hypothetical protein
MDFGSGPMSPTGLQLPGSGGPVFEGELVTTEGRTAHRHFRWELAWLPLVAFAATANVFVTAKADRDATQLAVRRRQAAVALQRWFRLIRAGAKPPSGVRAFNVRVHFLRRALTRTRVKLRHQYANATRSFLVTVHDKFANVAMIMALRRFNTRLKICQRLIKGRQQRRRLEVELRRLQFDRVVALRMVDLKIAAERPPADATARRDVEAAEAERAKLGAMPARVRDDMLLEHTVDYYAQWAEEAALYKSEQQQFAAKMAKGLADRNERPAKPWYRVLLPHSLLNTMINQIGRAEA